MGSHGMFVSKLAMFDSRSSMLLSFFMLAERMVMLGLIVLHQLLEQIAAHVVH